MIDKKPHFTSNQRKKIRFSFSKLDGMEIPSLVKLQQKSYDDFLYPKKQNQGLEGVFRAIFPLSDLDDNRITIEYVSYHLGKPKYDAEDAMERGVNYASPLIATFRLIIWGQHSNGEVNEDEVVSMKEQDVYIAEIPLMTERGTFIINGTERIVVSQMHRSPGVFYFRDSGKNSYGGKFMHYARVIPYNGSWLDFEFGARDEIYVRIDRKRKILITTFLTAIGMSHDDILDTFYRKKVYTRKYGQWISDLNIERMKDMRITKDVIDADTGDLLLKTGSRVTNRMIFEFGKSEKKRYIASNEEIVGRFLADDICGTDGSVLFSKASEVTDTVLEYIQNSSHIESFSVLETHDHRVGYYILMTLISDRCQSKDDAIAEIYKVLRPTDTYNPVVAERVFHNMFFTDERYNLSPVGRMKINLRHKLNVSEDVLHLTNDDIIAILRTLVDLKDGLADVDDIDNLANRRVRPVGELLENKFSVGMSRIQRSILEKINSSGMNNIDQIMLYDLINHRIIESLINEFFCTSQLSQLLENTNPLSALTNRRRVSALGPGGFMRDRIGQEAREINPSSYGKLCPIQTPEGPRVGLINSLSVYADINSYGLIQTPYKKVVDGKVTDEIQYLSAIEEIGHTIAQANASLNPDGSFILSTVECRRDGEFVTSQPFEISYMDVSPKQLVSVAASLIPFIENDDVTRALMGSNMQGQAVPLLHPRAPLVGTGMEAIVTRDTNTNVIAKSSGIVERVDANQIVIRVQERDCEIEKEKNTDKGKKNSAKGIEKNAKNPLGIGLDIYRLVKYQKTNQCTCINQIPIVRVGDFVNEGDIIADTSATNLGELALGTNVLVGFLSWGGYNFEDAIIISDRVAREDMFSSIHIQEYEVIARDTKLGPEEITSTVPIESETNIANLGESGIVSVGQQVKFGDILVGKVTPCAETPPIPEEKLLQTLFGEKSRDVKDTSLYCDINKGVVIGVRILTRRRTEKSPTALLFERAEIERLRRDCESQISLIEKFIADKIRPIAVGQILRGSIGDLQSGSTLTYDNLLTLSNAEIINLEVKNSEAMTKIHDYRELVKKRREYMHTAMDRKIEIFTSGDDLPNGALTVVRVKVAYKSRLQPGDKMSGRHGNKGIVSKIVPIEDMPFLDDGTPIDILLNPLGIPSRMNIGQVLETHLGWASYNIGQQVQQLLYNLADKDPEIVTEVLRTKILSIYDFDSEYCMEARKEIEKMNHDDLLEFTNNIQDGLPFAIPIFEGATEEEINAMFIKAGLSDTSGQVMLRDGRTGEYFDRPVTVGYKYLMKLKHLVEDKVHARSVGPYGLVNQQPLGGRSNYGGQRFGEMETWALEAYGAAFTLCEMLTVKSDDVEGRLRLYRKIVSGEDVSGTMYGLPESFKVILKELCALCLNVELIDKNLAIDLCDSMAKTMLKTLQDNNEASYYDENDDQRSEESESQKSEEVHEIMEKSSEEDLSESH